MRTFGQQQTFSSIKKHIRSQQLSFPVTIPPTQFTETQLDEAFAWLCHRRRNYPDHADVLYLRFHWVRERVHLFEQLRNRRYQLSPLQRLQKTNGEVIHLWSASDAQALNI